MMDYYNDNEPFCCAWIERVIYSGKFGPAVIEQSSITEITTDLSDFTQCHFFAGIGGWKIALNMAGWPSEAPVWTGSCPCQPFSQAGKQKGVSDERHLWPAWFSLICQYLPPVIFGEQVASPLGRSWLSGVLTDLETLGYRTAAADLCAAGIGAPHIRQRLWFVADRLGNTILSGRAAQPRKLERAQGTKKADTAYPPSRDDANRLVQSNSDRFQERNKTATTMGYRNTVDSASWTDLEWVLCADGKARPIKSGLCPVAYGIPKVAPKIAGYGNAIVPQVAATFIQAYMDTLGG